MIVLRPVGGLCNRILAIASAIQLSKDADRPLKIIWERDPLLNCSFQSLFTPLDNSIELIETQTKQRFQERILRKLTHLNFQKVFHLNTLATNKITVKDVTTYKKVLIYGANRFYLLGNLSGIFNVQKDIALRINQQTEGLGKNAIGLHIRRTDHKRSISQSPTSLFIEKIQQHLSENPNTLFFLATDSPEEESILKTKFKNNVITYTKRSLDRNSPEGIVDALVDLICLSHCDKIYGSYYSSFSFTAAHFHERELVVLTNS